MKIKELELRSLDLSATRTFYQDTLGLAIHDQDAELISFRIGDTLVAFSRADTGNPVYHMAFDIPKNKLEEACIWLKGKAEILQTAPGSVFSEFERWNARSLYFCDNNGNILELICRLDLDNASEAGFDASSFLHVSEIGIVTPDVPGQVQQMRQRYGLDIYPKQPPAGNFTVLGDEEGLFIIVKELRHWFPTEVEAGIFPLKIVFAGTTGRDEIYYTGYY